MKRTKKVAAIILTLVLCFTSISAAVFADESFVASVAITKVIEVPVGTELPTSMDFTFKTDPIGWDNATYDGTNMPTFDEVTLNYSNDMLILSSNAVAEGLTNPYSENGNDIYVLESGNIFDGLQGIWNGAGRYEYQITELPDTFQLNSDSNADYIEGMTFSSSSYTLFIYVLENANGDLYIDGIGVVKTKDDEGNDISDEKISVVTPGGDDKEYFFSQLQFKNGYWKTYKGDPENPSFDDTSLTVSKTINGDAIVSSDYDRFFTFNMTVNPPSVIPEDELPEFYYAYVVDTDDSIIEDLTNYADTSVIGNNGTQDYIKFVPGANTPFNLKHGQKLIFTSTPVGTSYEIVEAATPYFMPSYLITTAGVNGSEVSGSTSQSIATDTEYTGEGKGVLVNHAAFKNTCNSTPDTGLKKIPLYGFGLLAIACIGTYVTIKSRKEKDESIEK